MEAGAGTSATATRSGPSLKVLTFTSLFPSEVRPRHGIFVETRLAHLVRDCPVDARVVAPVPWFPFRAPVFGQYARFAATPRRATRANGVQVSYPRYLMLPRVGVAFQPDSMAYAAGPDIARWQRAGWQPELIDAHYLYPDGVAAALLAQRLRLPFVMTARGTDVNVLARTEGPAQRILWAAQRAAAVIAVSTRLKEVLVDLGVEPARIAVLRNGVDETIFQPEDPVDARRHLELPPAPLAVCVGNLVPEKGFDLAIESLQQLHDFHLVIVGDGPLRGELAQLARQQGVADRVSFLGAMPQQQLRHLYCAANVLLLTSTREGWPNVVLEAMACGTPVAATDVGAVGEMITQPHVGRIIHARDATVLSQAARELTSQASSTRQRIHEHALQFGWAPISAAQFEIMRGAVGHAPALALDAQSVLAGK